MSKMSTVQSKVFSIRGGSVKPEIWRRWKRIVNKGISIPAIPSGNSFQSYFNGNEVPSWWDWEQLVKAQKIMKRDYMSLFFSAFGGTLISLQVPSILTPVVFTGLTESIQDMFLTLKAYFETIRRLTTPEVSENHFIGMINEIRLLLKSISQEMNQTYPNPPSEEGVQMLWLSQYSLVLFQWSLVGPAMLFPSKVGLFDSYGSEFLEALNYLIGAIGHFIGVDEKYNLCLDTVDETRSLCKLVFRKVLQPVLRSSVLKSTPGYKIACEFGRASQPFFSAHVTGEMVLKYWYEVFGLHFAFQPIITSNKDRVFLNFWRKLMSGKSRRTRRLLMNLFIAKHKGADKHVVKICVRLSELYPNVGHSMDKYICDAYVDGVVRMVRETSDTKLTRSRLNTRESTSGYSIQSNIIEVVQTQI